jgi:hypothetical protein
MNRYWTGPAISAALLLGIATLAGCGGSGPDSAALGAAPLPRSQARLKIHRESALMGMALDVRVTIDGREVAGLGNDETKILDIPAGAHKITVDHWSQVGVSKLDLQAKPGTLYEIEVAVREDAAAAGLVFGVVGTVAESEANGGAGFWSIQVVKQRPAV